MLTSEEALVMANVAERYPIGHGWDYLVPDNTRGFDGGSEWECALLHQAQPNVRAACAPELALAIRRLSGAQAHFMPERLVGELEDSTEDMLTALSLDVDTYAEGLHRSPAEIATRLRRFATAHSAT